ncbi:hypothetical protein [Francisella frigiditurris]|uniref:Kinase domain protein n=1 Tax=Francisella frigiditurris TaxID=1542390 RepID=A0A1J0KRE6_9GAMM|nr:hypothetical protein [Francisella frigiditurris]APC96222.1 kinase domain protein [Francisella frigiditurris]
MKDAIFFKIIKYNGVLRASFQDSITISKTAGDSKFTISTYKNRESDQKFKNFENPPHHSINLYKHGNEVYIKKVKYYSHKTKEVDYNSLIKKTLNREETKAFLSNPENAYLLREVTIDSFISENDIYLHIAVYKYLNQTVQTRIHSLSKYEYTATLYSARKNLQVDCCLDLNSSKFLLESYVSLVIRTYSFFKVTGFLHRDIKPDNILIKPLENTYINRSPLNEVVEKINNGELFFEIANSYKYKLVLFDHDLSKLKDIYDYKYICWGTPLFNAPAIIALSSILKKNNIDDSNIIIVGDMLSFVFTYRELVSYKLIKSCELKFNIESCFNKYLTDICNRFSEESKEIGILISKNNKKQQGDLLVSNKDLFEKVSDYFKSYQKNKLLDLVENLLSITHKFIQKMSSFTEIRTDQQVNHDYEYKHTNSEKRPNYKYDLLTQYNKFLELEQQYMFYKNPAIKQLIYEVLIEVNTLRIPVDENTFDNIAVRIKYIFDKQEAMNIPRLETVIKKIINILEDGYKSIMLQKSIDSSIRINKIGIPEPELKHFFKYPYDLKNNETEYYPRKFETALSFLMIKYYFNNSDEVHLLSNKISTINDYLKKIIATCLLSPKLILSHDPALWINIAGIFTISQAIDKDKDIIVNMPDEIFANFRDLYPRLNNDIFEEKLYDLEDNVIDLRIFSYAEVLRSLKIHFPISRSSSYAGIRSFCKLIMLTQAYNWLPSKLTSSIHSNFIDSKLSRTYDEHPYFKDKGPKIDNSKTTTAMGLMQKSRLPELSRSKVNMPSSRSIAPKKKDSDWNKFRIDEKQIYVSGISGIGLLLVKVLEIYSRENKTTFLKKEYMQIMPRMFPIFTFFFTGHSHFELFNGVKEAYKSLYLEDFYTWEEYVDSIPCHLFKFSTNLALFA